MKIKIDYKFTDLNTYINAERGNKYGGAAIKKGETEAATWYFKGKKIQTPCKLIFTWHTKNRRKDPDNIAFASKFIIDGMVAANAIPNDNLNHVQAISHRFKVDGSEWVEVEVEEWNN